MFLFCSRRGTRIIPMAPQSAAVRRPPAPQPSLPETSAPAGGFARRGQPLHGQDGRPRPAAVDLAAPTDGEGGVEAPPRRGRGARSNAWGLYEWVARTAFDDGWQSFEGLPP